MLDRFFPWALAALALAAFHPALGSSFHFDDYTLLNDPAVTEPDGWRQAFALERTRPLTYLTFWINYQLGGTGPRPYHAVNLALHLLSVWAAWRVTRRVAPGSAAMLATACFALHPLQTEAVAYVFARATLLMALLSLLSWNAWIAGHRGVAVAWFLCALLAKEEAAGFLLFLAGWLALARGGRRELPAHWRPLAVMAAAAGAVFARTLYAAWVTPQPGALTGLGDTTPGRYFLSQGAVLLEYFRKFLWPSGLNFDNDAALAQPSDLWAWAAWAAVLFAVLAPFWFRLDRGTGFPARQRYWPLGALLLLAPTSSVLPLADLHAERRMYLAVAMLGLFAGGALDWLAARKPYVKGPAVVMALSLVWWAVSYQRAQVWRTEESLWRDAAAKSPRKVRPKLQLARALGAAGAEARTERLELLRQARALAPDDPPVAEQLGLFFLEAGQPEQAAGHFRLAAGKRGDAHDYSNLGAALWMSGQPGAAAAALHEALERDPCRFDARNNLILVYRAQADEEQVRKVASAPQDCAFTAEQQRALEAARRLGR